MKDITSKIYEAKNQITGIKTIYLEVGPNDWNYIGVPQSKVGERAAISPEAIILKKTNINEIPEIFEKYSLENGFCFTIIRCFDGREYGGERCWEFGLPGYYTWSTEKNVMTSHSYSKSKWSEHNANYNTPEEFFKFFGKNYPAVIAVVKIEDYNNAVDKITK